MKIDKAKFVVPILTAGGLGVLGTLAVFLFIPALKEDLKLSNSIEQAYAELEAQYANRKNLLQSRVKLTESRGKIDRLSKQFTPLGREIDLITSIEAITVRNGVDERIQLTEAATKRAPELKESFVLTLNGPYHGVMQTLVDLEKMPALLLTEAMEIRPGSRDEKGFPYLNVIMRGTIVTPPNGAL